MNEIESNRPMNGILIGIAIGTGIGILFCCAIAGVLWLVSKGIIY